MNDRVAGLAAGLDLEMPASGGITDAQIVAAVTDGSLDERVLDTAAARVAELALRGAAAVRVAGPLDVDAHHALAREAAGRSVILLKNDGDLLPLAPETNLAVIGEFAQSPRYQGAGSSRINPTRPDRAIDEIRKLATGTVTFDAGFSAGEEAVAEAVASAAAADVAVVFLGLPGDLESEGFDRADISLPAEQLALLDAVLVVNPRTVVVLSHGGVVALPFAGRVPAILDASLLGQAGGGGTADVLYGLVNPSAKLTETVPERLEDAPSYENFPGEHGHVRYGEGLFVGYRGYDHRDLPVAFPFGHGLSYTAFEYSAAGVAEAGGGDIEVRVTVTNVGDRDGAEVVQFYTSVPGSAVTRPVRELKGFGRIALAAGESGEAVITVRREDLAYWDTRVGQWVVEPGDYTFEVGASSRDIRATVTFAVSGDVVTVPISRESSLGEVFANPRAMAALQRAIEQSGNSSSTLSFSAELKMMLASFPVGRMAMFGLSPDQIDAFVRDAG